MSQAQHFLFKRRNVLLIVGLLPIAMVLFTALFAAQLAPYDPNSISLVDRYQPPSLQHPFGRDENGSDVLSKVIWGARISLVVSVSVVTISLLIGLVVGSLGGFFGGWVDLLIMRFVDTLLAFPSFLLALGLVAVIGPSVRNVVVAMCLTGWAGYARLVRGEMLNLKEREFVLSAISLGCRPFRIIVIHLWPNLVGPLVVHATFSMAGTILAESSLSFLGLGAPPTTPTWGSLLNSGRRILEEAPHVSLFPGLAILLLVFGFNLFGDGLRDYLDPNKS